MAHEDSEREHLINMPNIYIQGKKAIKLYLLAEHWRLTPAKRKNIYLLKNGKEEFIQGHFDKKVRGYAVGGGAIGLNTMGK